MVTSLLRRRCLEDMTDGDFSGEAVLRIWLRKKFFVVSFNLFLSI